MIKTIYQDKYNPNKTWEVTSMSHGFYLKQFICNKQFGRGLRTTREYIKSMLVILDSSTGILLKSLLI